MTNEFQVEQTTDAMNRFINTIIKLQYKYNYFGQRRATFPKELATMLTSSIR